MTGAGSCAAVSREPDSIRSGVRCTSWLVKAFVDRLRDASRYRDAVVVLFSDHLAMRNSEYATLQQVGDGRRLFFLALLPGGQPGKISAPGTHFDVAPTLLDMVGITGYGEFPFGHSLLHGAEGFVFRQKLSPADFVGFNLRSLKFRRQTLSGPSADPAIPVP